MNAVILEIPKWGRGGEGWGDSNPTEQKNSTAEREVAD